MERLLKNKTLLAVVLILVFLFLIGSLACLAYFGKDYFPFISELARPSSSSEAASSEDSPEQSDSSESESESQKNAGGSDESADESSGSSEDSSEPQKSPKPNSSEPDEATEENEPEIVFNKPDEMRAVFLAPGRDYPITGGEAAIVQGIDKALEIAEGLTLNTVVLPLYDDTNMAIYRQDGTAPAGEIDILSTVIERARLRGMYSYVIYNASAMLQGESVIKQENIDVKLIDFAVENAGKLVKNYAPDGILIDSYYNESRPDSYSKYIRSGSGMGYENFLRAQSEALFTSVSGAVRQSAPNTQVGIVADGVWQNAETDEGGSKTTASFTALGVGNADTRAFVEEGYADFIAVYPGGAMDSAQEPFGEVVSWWCALAQSHGLPLYVIQSSEKICTDAPGFSSPDELVREIISARENKSFEGSMFTSLSRLSENPETSTDLLLKLYNNEINVEHVLTRLAVTVPESAEFATLEPSMVFRGASDPNFEATLDGEALETDENGYFTVTKDLAAGINEFVFEHKGVFQTFKITRNVQIIKEISPQGSLAMEGGMQLEVTALAYSDAAVSASVGGISIPMQRDDSVDDETDENSSYSRFRGVCTVPAGTPESQTLGTITVNAQWSGMSDSKTGATVTINPIVAAGDEGLVVVTAASAKTFPVGVLNNESSAACFPLPKGTKDYTVGDKLSFTNASGDTYHYYKLQSGLRVYADDVSAVDGALSTGNVIEDMQITSDKKYTYVALGTQQPVPYLVSYGGSALKFNFQYTSGVPKSQSVEGNPVISDASFSGSTLTLTLKKPGSFLGYHAYYKDGKLVLRLTNPPTSMSGVRVAIDPGHGGKDTGARGFYPDVNESQINAQIAEKTASALSSAGASVKLITTTPYLTLNQRLEAARAFEADVYISIHCNSSRNSSATGTEVFYLYQSGQALASYASKAVSGALGTENRGAKQAAYWVTADSRFASVLVETGFISNKNEYKKLVQDSYQQEIADGIANAVKSYVSAVGTGISGGNDSTFGNPGDDEPAGSVFDEDEDEGTYDDSFDEESSESSSEESSEGDDFWQDDGSLEDDSSSEDDNWGDEQDTDSSDDFWADD